MTRDFTEEDKADLERFAGRIRGLLKFLAMEVEEFADEIGVHKKVPHRWISGKEPPRGRIIFRIQRFARRHLPEFDLLALQPQTFQEIELNDDLGVILAANFFFTEDMNQVAERFKEHPDGLDGVVGGPSGQFPLLLYRGWQRIRDKYLDPSERHRLEILGPDEDPVRHIHKDGTAHVKVNLDLSLIPVLRNRLDNAGFGPKKASSSRVQAIIGSRQPEVPGKQL